MNLNVLERLICTLRGLSRFTDRVNRLKKTKQLKSEEKVNMEMMEVDEPLSSSEAPQAPALEKCACGVVFY